MDTALRVAEKLRSAQTIAFAHAFCRLAPYVVVNEYPKSGGSWLSDLLCDALQYKTIRNRMATLAPSVVNGHFYRPGLLSNVVVIWRDPRDVVVSFYHHCYFVNEYGNRIFVNRMKARRPFLDYEDVSGNLPEFIRMLTTNPVFPSYSWPDFAARWAGREDAVHTRYETLRHETAEELRRIVAAVAGVDLAPERAEEIADAHSFARAKARAAAKADAGTEVSFVREGSTGGWRKHFTPEALEAMRELGYGPPMARLGYEL